MKKLMTILALTATLSLSRAAAGDPEIDVRYYNGVPRVAIEGDYAQTRYTVWRSQQAAGPYAAVSNRDVLCLGSCFFDDYDAAPGASYWYRFDLILADGSLASFGPYPVEISGALARTIGARVMPNPSRGPAVLELVLNSSDQPVAGEAALFDLQGRRIATMFRGPVSRGTTRVAWNGRRDDGADLAAGSYFLRFTAGAHQSITRISRAH
ncbi:MAG TPA: FlgD immunoglobulin-like domain containing protein [Candidatus Limnocylindria bacterium]|nr:FlgD immunoglobulin-like domain containing protein [Candidatus Limnocylindria bacterium]